MDHEAKRGLSAMTDRLARAEPQLDELARERVLARVQAQIGAETSDERTGHAARFMRPALLAAAAAALVWFVVESRATRPVASTRSAVAAPRREAAAPPALALIPYLFSGGSAARADALLDQAQTRIELVEGERLLAALGERARLALVGPAALRVLRAEGERVELELEHGLLLADYDHQQGGALVIDSPGARAEVVGTLFSIRALGEQSQVAVARGHVRVRAGEQRVDVGTARAWSTGLSTTEALPDGAATELALHARSLRPSTGARGVLGITGELLDAEFGEQWLGPTPLWALMPAGSNTIALHDLRDRTHALRSLRTTVRSAERTELVIEASRGEDTHGQRPASSGPATSLRHARATQRGTDQPSADALYAAAERSMREGQIGRAAELLEEMLANHPTARNRDLALYDLALAAYKRADFARAIALLERLDREPPRASLRELSAYLRCRAVLALAPAQATACLDDFRRRFPDSPHATQPRTDPRGSSR